MPALVRKFKKIFAGSATNNGVFGSAAALSPAVSNDPATIESLAAWSNGWDAATISGNKLPALQDMQGLKYDTDYHLAYIYQTGMQVYDSQTTYYQTDLVRKPATTQIWKSLVDNNTGNPLVEGVNWTLTGDLANIPASNGYILKSFQIFTSSGTWTKPANIKAALVRVVGGGGQGGSANTATPASGGGGGGYSEKFITSGLNATETVTVGAGGTTGTAGTDGQNGTSSSFGAHCSSTGGGGGKNSSGSGTGDGGVGSGGDINLKGGAGNPGFDANIIGSGGGVPGLASPTSFTVGTTPTNGNLYGGGGSGAGSGAPGGSGANGVVIVYEYV